MVMRILSAMTSSTRCSLERGRDIVHNSKLLSRFSYSQMEPFLNFNEQQNCISKENDRLSGIRDSSGPGVLSSLCLFEELRLSSTSKLTANRHSTFLSESTSYPSLRSRLPFLCEGLTETRYHPRANAGFTSNSSISFQNLFCRGYKTGNSGKNKKQHKEAYKQKGLWKHLNSLTRKRMIYRYAFALQGVDYHKMKHLRWGEVDYSKFPGGWQKNFE